MRKIGIALVCFALLLAIVACDDTNKGHLYTGSATVNNSVSIHGHLSLYWEDSPFPYIETDFFPTFPLSLTNKAYRYQQSTNNNGPIGYVIDDNGKLILSNDEITFSIKKNSDKTDWTIRYYLEDHEEVTKALLQEVMTVMEEYGISTKFNTILEGNGFMDDPYLIEEEYQLGVLSSPSLDGKTVYFSLCPDKAYIDNTIRLNPELFEDGKNHSGEYIVTKEIADSGVVIGSKDYKEKTNIILQLNGHIISSQGNGVVVEGGNVNLISDSYERARIEAPKSALKLLGGVTILSNCIVTNEMLYTDPIIDDDTSIFFPTLPFSDEIPVEEVEEGVEEKPEDIIHDYPLVYKDGGELNLVNGSQIDPKFGKVGVYEK